MGFPSVTSESDMIIRNKEEQYFNHDTTLLDPKTKTLDGINQFINNLRVDVHTFVRKPQIPHQLAFLLNQECTFFRGLHNEYIVTLVLPMISKGGIRMRYAKLFVIGVAVMMLLMALGVNAEKGVNQKAKEKCTTIQSGELLTSYGDVIETGYDEWGYNYQAHMFNGMYCDAYRDAAWCQPYADVSLMMKWNDAWLSNKDCDGDGLLDRHYGFDSYIGSGAWVTNHQSGEYLDENGEVCTWNYFVKIVAVPEDATSDGGYWYSADGEEIGPVIWGQFAIIQQVSNDKCAGEHGVQYLSPVSAGLGYY